ncbi:ankyrin repeat domain-containing protein 37 [Erpetoichthys calabaricus]|uniref:Ankyrin repeat domain 37 n=1 Tax=Erpetoichthys calabaricus TaxID=27687 RepID=A0A8C4RKZ3_ERPCA|nr:ankyrin repeat domain-containing protein 37 [Erpetoichthys calabaricus]
MFLFESDSQMGYCSSLMECDNSVNSPGDLFCQTPVHLAASAGEPFTLMWLLKTGADANLQDIYGEAPIHKAAKAGSFECLSLLVASNAKLDLCNHDGQMAEDLAFSCGFSKCAAFLAAVKEARMLKLCGELLFSPQNTKDNPLKRSHGPQENSGCKRTK